MSLAEMYSTATANNRQLTSAVYELANKEKEVMRFRDEFERYRGRCKHLADYLTTQLAENEKLKEENQNLYKQLAETGRLDNDPRFISSATTNTEIKNLKGVIEQQNYTIIALKNRKMSPVPKSTELPEAEKVRLTEENFNLRQEIYELNVYKEQVVQLAEERKRLCDQVLTLGKFQEENFKLKMVINQLKANQKQSALQSSQVESTGDVEKLRYGILNLYLICNSYKSELEIYRSKSAENVLVQHYKEIVSTLEDEMNRLCEMI